MFFYFALIAAEYFKFAKEDKYLGVVDGNNLGKVDEKNALNFLRIQADTQKVHTILKAEGIHRSGTVTFNKNNEMILGSGNTKFIISLDYNGKYVLVADDKCVVDSDIGLKRVTCNSSTDVAYFDIKPFTATTEYTRKSLVILGPKTDKFNPEDPLADQIYDGIVASDEDTEKVMLPYKERLKDKPRQEITNQSKAKVVLVKFNVF
ncbi:hypothetical protein PAEPH01_0555 [Pancytospora epiphaga]|nr:hypothetical protein PAEPH01_0555 [Pancytospora epiphaga]